MIRSFRCRETRRLFETGKSRRFSTVAKIALRRHDQLDNVTQLRLLAIPPGTHPEASKGDRLGQFSIPTNQQWCVCFRWSDQGPEDVEIVDDH